MTDARQPDSDQAVSQISQFLAQAAESQRQLAQEMSVFAKDESLRFANLRLERNGSTLDKLQNCHGIPGLINVQQEWLRDFLQDYSSQSMRMMSQAKDAMDRTSEVVQKAGDQMSHMAQDNSGHLQETQH